MGSAKSRPRSISFEEEVEGHSETTKTCCWTGIRKLFSKSKKSKSMAMHIMEDEMDSDDNNDDVIIANDSIKPSAASIQSVTAVEPRDLHNSWSAPAVLGQDRHQAMMPAALSKVEDELPSTSYPKDVRVSSEYFLFYHRYINDEEKDDESVASDIEYKDEDNDADVDSNANDDTTPVPGLVYSEDEYTDDDRVVDQKEENEIKNAIEESSEDDTSSQANQTVMANRYDHDLTTKVKQAMKQTGHPEKYPDSTFNIWDCIRKACDSVYQTGLQFIQDILIGEDEDEMDVEEERAGVVHGETEDRIPKGHPERYPDFNIWAYIRKACDSVYQNGLQFVQDIVIGEDEDDMDVD